MLHSYRMESYLIPPVSIILSSYFLNSVETFHHPMLQQRSLKFGPTANFKRDTVNSPEGEQIGLFQVKCLNVSSTSL